MCLYVNNVLIVDSNDKMIKYTKDMLNSRFIMKDMWLVNVTVGIISLEYHMGLS